MGAWFATLVCGFTVAVLSNALAENSPVGAYLWFPGPGSPASDQDCRSLVANRRTELRRSLGRISRRS